MLAFIGSAPSAATMSAHIGNPRLTRTKPSGARALLFTSPGATATPNGARLGRPPLPYVELALSEGDCALVTRGGFGGRPAYIRTTADLALAATDLGALVRASRALGLPSTLDPDALACKSAHLPALDASTIYAEISEVPSGTRATVAPGGGSSTRLSAPRATAAEADAAALLDAITRAVSAALADGRTGVLTGGGLDSSALVALARRLGGDVSAFAIDHGGDDSDRPYLAELARAHALSPCRVTVGDESFALGDDAAGLPLVWPSGALEATLLLRAKEWGARAVLCGAFADACFDGHPEAASRVLLRRGPAHAVSMARAYDGAPLAEGAWRVLRPHARRLLPGPLRHAARALVGDRPPSRAFDGPRLRRARERAWLRGREERRASDDAQSRIESAFRSADLHMLAELRAQEEALSGVVRADPYLSAELATFALSLRPDVLLGDGRRRGLFRQAVAGLLPREIVERTGKASFRPLHASLLAHAKDGQELNALADLGIVDARAMRAALRDRSTDHAGELLSLLAMERWLTRGAS